MELGRKYASRFRALAASFSKPITGYEAEALTRLVFEKTVAFNQLTSLDLRMGSERLLLAISMALGGKEPKSTTGILDFGGACGVHHKLASLLFPDAKLRWAVVETPAMARIARSLETESLRFFEDIGSARTWLETVDMVNSNSALQYVEHPRRTVEELLDLVPRILLWERMMLTNDATHADQQTSLLFDHGPGPVPPGFKNRLVRQKVTRLSRTDFLAAHNERYRLRCTADDGGHWSTYLFSRK
jgi:putative methyltransferase (TIGR04325 family)